MASRTTWWHGGGPLSRGQVIAALRAEGSRARADAHQIKLDLDLELMQAVSTLVQQRRETETGLSQARKHLEVLEINVAEIVAPHVAEGDKVGHAGLAA
eukprot:3159083-Pyramimonas_sp.AAC.1